MIELVFAIGFVLIYFKLSTISKKLEKLDAHLDFVSTKLAYLQMEIEDASLSEVDRMSEERVKMKRKFLEFSNQSIDKFKNFY